jgi:hypothetical protein
MMLLSEWELDWLEELILLIPTFSKAHIIQNWYQV